MGGFNKSAPTVLVFWQGQDTADATVGAVNGLHEKDTTITECSGCADPFTGAGDMTAGVAS